MLETPASEPVLIAGSVVVIVAKKDEIVAAGMMDPGIVVPFSVINDTVFTTVVSVIFNPETNVSTVSGNITVSELTDGIIVDGGTVHGSRVEPGTIMVYVLVTISPRSLAGIAVPTPEDVNCTGIGRVAVLGFREELEE